MKVLVKRILGVVLVMTALLISSHGMANEKTQGNQKSVAEGVLPAATPELNDIVPLAVKLSGRLAVLKNRIERGPDISALEKKYDEIKANFEILAGQLQYLKDSKDYKYNKLLELRETIRKESKLFDEISKPFMQAIHQLGAWRDEWVTEKKRWNEWQASLLKETEFGQLKSTFEKAMDTIDTALNLVVPQLGERLAVQEKAGDIKAKIRGFAAELDGLIENERRNALIKASPPLFSSRYFSQFESGLGHAVQKCLDDVLWPDSRFFVQQGWAIVLQSFLFLFVIIVLYRNRQALNESKRWGFLAARPLSAGLFLAFMAIVLFYEYEGAPAIWKLANMMVAGIFFARLISALVEASWKRQFVYGLAIILIATHLMDAISFPLPLFRLYTVLTSLLILFFCFRWVGESRRQNDPDFYIWLLRLVSLFFAAIMVAELWGKASLAIYLFLSLIRSIGIVLVFILFMYMIHGGLEWLFRSSPLLRVAVLKDLDPDAMIHRAERLFDVAIWGLAFLPAILTIWKVYDNLERATKGLLAFGFNLGSQRINVGLLIVTTGIIYGSFLASWILKKLLMDEVIVKSRMERGVRHSMVRLVHYAVISVGFLLAISMLGFDITKITIIIGALGVGIGFGLQGVVNNFVSGLILLFEGPVRVGDFIEVSGKWAEIKKIGLRATIVETLEQANLIIPNADLINNQVINWTLSTRRVRLTVPVGVAYGSDVPLVIDTLMASAKAIPKVAGTLTPQVLFLSFGDSSLDFELRVWIWDADHRLAVISELHQEIDRRFREANIEIAFPQRDLHLRGVDESIVLRPPKTKEVME